MENYCLPLNYNLRPNGAASRQECCRLYCGYSIPSVLIVLVLGIFTGHSATFIQIILDSSHSSPWRVAVSAICLCVGVCLLVLWGYTYFMIMMTSPGYVPVEVWRFPPTLVKAGERTPSAASACSSDDAARETSGFSAAEGGRGAVKRSRYDQDSQRIRNREEREEVGVEEDKKGSSHKSGTAMEDPAASTPPPPVNPFHVRVTATNGELRYCHYCNCYKPDHAYHCKMCGKCVYMFDHHCPWINNCVGRNNFKLFIAFLLNSSMALFIIGALVLIGLFVVDEQGADYDFRTIYRLGVGGFALILGFTLILFALQFVILFKRGLSTVEGFIGQATDRKMARNKERGLMGGCGCDGGDCDNNVCPTYPYEESPEEKRRRIQRHQEGLLGRKAERRWWHLFVPKPIRTDDGADEEFYCSSGRSKKRNENLV